MRNNFKSLQTVHRPQTTMFTLLSITTRINAHLAHQTSGFVETGPVPANNNSRGAGWG